MSTEKTANKKTDARQEVFVREYLIDLNGTRAAIAAGYSEKGADVAAIRMLGNARVQKLIAELTEQRLKRLDITADRVLGELARLAFVDPRKFFNDDGTAKPISQLDDDTAAALAGVEVFEEFEGSGENRKFAGYTKKFKIADKRGSLELLGKHLKLFTDKIEHGGQIGEYRIVTNVKRPHAST